METQQIPTSSRTHQTGEAIDGIARQFAETAMRGAADVLARRGMTREAIAEDAAVCAALRAECRTAIVQALEDAREAARAGMGQCAATTFAASAWLAGKRAVDRWQAERATAQAVTA